MAIHTRSFLKRTTFLSSAVFIALLSEPAAANPEGGTVVGGSATITAPNPSTVRIDQSTNRAIINWNSFNIGTGETALFVVPNAEAWTLNRVVGSQNPSRIYGSINSNGNVVIVNPDGMLLVVSRKWWKLISRASGRVEFCAGQAAWSSGASVTG